MLSNLIAILLQSLSLTMGAAKMGDFVNSRPLQSLAWFTAVLIAGLNA